MLFSVSGDRCSRVAILRVQVRSPPSAGVAVTLPLGACSAVRFVVAAAALTRSIAAFGLSGDAAARGGEDGESGSSM